MPSDRRPYPDSVSESGSDESLVKTRCVTPFSAPSAPMLTPPPVARLSLYASSSAVVSDQSVIPMPQPGDTFFGFRLVEELGRGTFARVFLAKQDSLAGRDVALKVSLRPTREADRLARLQHTNIVPVYSVHTVSTVQLICMPFLGRQTLADLIVGHRRNLAATGLSTRRVYGTRKGSTTLIGSKSKTVFRDTPSSKSQPATVVKSEPDTKALVGDVGAVLGILSGLSDGLAHAHARGILHLDLKPANVLLPTDGEPMLLDFNLSFDSIESEREVVGGTIPYMAPEQLFDLRSRGKGAIDARTDLYSLGVLAFELLSGMHPFAFSSKTLADFDGLMAARKNGPPSLRELNPNVSPAVEAIVRKLLAPEPNNRYQSAADLHEDLERQLADRPLRYAPDRSVSERMMKWRRRNPWALGAMALLGVFGLASGAGTIAYEKHEALTAREAEARIRRTRDGLDSLRLDLVMPGNSIARSRGIDRALGQLREYGLPDDMNWREGAAFLAIPAADRSAVAADLGELLLLVAHARWEEGKNTDRQAAALDTYRLNRIAEGCFDKSLPPFLMSQRSLLTDIVNRDPNDVLEQRESTSAREHFLDAVDHMSQGQYSTAVRSLERAIAERPDHAASQFCLAYSRHQLGQYARAIERYDTARVLIPKDARPSFFRGVAFGQQGKPGTAEEEFTQALTIDPSYRDAYRNRGVARIELKKYLEAESDLSEALSREASPIQIHLLRAQLRDLRKDLAGAKADREAAAEYSPEHADDFLVRGCTRLPKDPSGALSDFETASLLNPRSLPAWQNQAHVRSCYLNDDKGALTAATRATELFPECGVARAGRAVLLARLGQREEAMQEADRVRTLSDDPKVTYQLACVYSILSKNNPEDREKALSLLRQAFRNGYRDVRLLETDTDLDPLRTHADFDRFVEAAKNLVD